MNLNRRVPNGLPGGVRGRKFYYFLLLDSSSKKSPDNQMLSGLLVSKAYCLRMSKSRVLFVAS